MNETTFAAVLRACGSDGHQVPDYDEPLTPPQLLEVLAQVHPRVMAKMATRWADARDELGGSSAEHPHFREDVRRLLEKYPEGYT